MSHINNFNKDGFVLIQNQIFLIKQSGHASYTPLTASNLTIDEIYSMTDKMIEAHKEFLPEYH